MPELSEHDALVALNQLRCNIVGTQSASWSNVAYPLVAILNDAGFELHEPTQDQMHEHLSTYGGAGGYPGNPKKSRRHDWNNRLVGARENLVRVTRKYLENPTEKNRGYLENALKRAEEVKR